MIEPRLRPLRRIRAGKWKSRDGRFTFTGPAALFPQGTSNELFWHIHEEGYAPAYGEREPTLRDAVGAVEYEYRDLSAAPSDARERILNAVRPSASPVEPKDIAALTGMSKSQALAWVAHMAFEGSLREERIYPDNPLRTITGYVIA